SLADAADVPESEKLAAAALARFPRSARLNFEYAFLHHRRGLWAQAAPHLESAMQADPSFEEPFYLYGDLLVQQQQHEKAIPYFRKAIALRPEYVPARMALARVFMRSQQWADARREVEAASAARPSDPQPFLLLSQILFRQGDAAAARAAREKSLALRRANPAALDAPQNRPFPK
ncbi:MAG: tetratricopeptide repeat protein, partial [Ilumatobacteraceae bacterium]